MGKAKKQTKKPVRRGPAVTGAKLKSRMIRVDARFAAKLAAIAKSYKLSVTELTRSYADALSTAMGSVKAGS